MSRRLRVRRAVNPDNVLEGMAPNRDEPGSRRAVTRLFAHRTPGQLHGVVSVVFQSRVRPPTAERKDKSAALSPDRSEETLMKKKKKRRSNIPGNFSEPSGRIVLVFNLQNYCGLEEKRAANHLVGCFIMKHVGKGKVSEGFSWEG